MTGTTEPAVDILPCPFCGEMPRSHLFHGDYGGMQIDCMTPNCPASPITTGNSMSDPLIAFNAWNRRAAIVCLKAIPGASILGAHDGTMPDAVYDAIKEPADTGETIRQLRVENQRLRDALQCLADEALMMEIPEGYGPEDTGAFQSGYDAAIVRARTILGEMK